MKTLISDYENELHLGGTAKPAFRKLWVAAVTSGTCMVAHESAATWMMKDFYRVVLSPSSMSTVAALSLLFCSHCPQAPSQIGSIVRAWAA